MTRIGKVRNEYIIGVEQVGKSGEKTREARLRWFEHVWSSLVWRKDDGNIGRWMLTMELLERGNGEGLKGGLWMRIMR